MNQQPSISVVIPVKNEGKRIRACIDGILSQTVDVLEIIVIDSGSTDDTLQILAEYPIVKVIEIPGSEFNHGTTRNLGVEATKGEFVLLTVGDARAFNSDWIAELLKGFIDDEVVAVCGQQVVSHDAENNPMDWHMPISEPVLTRVQFKQPSFSELSPAEKYKACHLDDVTALYRREALVQLPFKKITYGEDMLWCKEALEQGYAIVYNYKAKVFHYHLENAEYTFKITFTKCYFVYTQFRHLMGASRLTLLDKVKLIRSLFLRLGFKPLTILKWYFYNRNNQKECLKALELFNSNVDQGLDRLRDLHSKYCGKPPIPVK